MPWWPEADAEHGDLRVAQDVCAHTEVVPALGTAGPRREDDRVEVLARQRLPGDFVVVHDHRLFAGHRGEQVKDVVGVGVVVVHEQRAHPTTSKPEPAGAAVEQRLHDPLDVFAAVAFEVPAREVAQIQGERAQVKALHAEAQVAAVELGLHDGEAIGGVLRGLPERPAHAAAAPRLRARDVPAEALSSDSSSSGSKSMSGVVGCGRK